MSSGIDIEMEPWLDTFSGDLRYSMNRFQGDGLEDTFELQFAGGYIDSSHVKAYAVNTTTQVKRDIEFTFVDAFNITVTSAVVTADEVLVVYRDTPKSTPLVNFTDGAIYNEANMDKVVTQAVFATAEMVDTAGEAVDAAVTAAETAAAAIIAADASADAAAASALAAAASASAASDSADDATSNGAAQVALAAAQVTLAEGFADNAAASAVAADASADAAALSEAGAAAAAAGAVATHESAYNHAAFLVAADIPAKIAAAASKVTPVDADMLAVVDSADANSLKKLTWANLKATLKTYFDTLYTTLATVIATASTWSAPQRGTLTAQTSLTVNMNTSNKFKITPSAGGALTFSNITSGQGGTIIFVNGSNYAITAAATTKVTSTFLATISATGTYTVSYESDGTNVFCSCTGAQA